MSPDRSKHLISVVECPQQSVVEKLVELLRGLKIVPGQQTNESLDTSPGLQSPSPQIVVEQLGDQVLAVQLRSADLSGGQCSQQGQTMLHSGGGAAIAGVASVANPQTTNAHS